MRSKRLLTLAMVLCLLISVIAPAASAVEISAGASSLGSATNSPSNKLNDLLVNAGNALGINSLRDHPLGSQVAFENGKWVISPADSGPADSLMNAALTESLEELNRLSDHYQPSDIVSAFVVLEDAPLAERYSSIRDVPEKESAYLLQKQDAVATAIGNDVLGGKKLEIVTQFTYLTNSLVVSVEFGSLADIAMMSGVKSVFVSPEYYACQTESVYTPYTVTSGQMSNVPEVWAEELGYTGKGMTIAILDTGLDTDHPSFADSPALGETSWDLEFLAGIVGQLNASVLYNEATGKELTAEDLFLNDKVPFRFNYANGSTHVDHDDGVGDHGTHVSGIAAANAIEGVGVVGMAPDAQIVTMKVFNEGGGARMYDILNALEDAMLLGCDVANLSLGTAAGFTSTDVEELDSIYNRIAETDIIVDIAAGNEGTSAYGDSHGNMLNPTYNIDNATVSSPSTYNNAMSVGSVDSNVTYNAYFTLADGTNVFYMQSVEYLYGYISYNLEILAGQTVEYAIVPGLGEVEDFYDAEGNSIVEGKVAVVKRGEINFSTKAFNAQAAGAVACIIWNSNDEDDIFSFGMTTADAETGSYPDIPVSLISLSDGQLMADAEVKTLVASNGVGTRPDPEGGQMSSFSSWGVAPDLTLLPDISGVGGNIVSCYDGGVYGIMSGTSMATPQVAGVTALVLQYLKETYPDATDAEIRVLVDSLVMSTAVPVVDSASGVEASPRQQGAGLINALYAITSEAYLTVAGSERPKAELFDSEDGTYSFTFSVHNFGDTEKTYTISSSLLCEDAVYDPNWDMYFMAEQDRALDNSGVVFSADTVTVAPGESQSITVTISLADADKEWIDAIFPNGNYVEGYVYLTCQDGVDLSLPFLGFYGDWTDAPIFDSGYWYGNEMWGIYGDEPECDQYYHVLWTDLGGTDWVLGFNPYTGALVDPIGNVIYDSANNVLSPNGDGILDGFSEIYLSLLRNAKYVTFTYTDAEGNVLDEMTLDHISKTMYNSNYGQVVPFVYSWYYYLEYLYDFTDAEGNVLPSGTQLYLTITGSVDYENDRVTDATYRIPVLIDTEAPVALGMEEFSQNGRNYLAFLVSDDSLAYAALMNPAGTRTYADAADADFIDNGDGTQTIIMDITGCGNNFMLALCDYGANESFFNVQYTAGDNVMPVYPENLYAYSCYDLMLGSNYGTDYMYGWTTIDKVTGEASYPFLTSDAMEYYALTAAEYAGGYVFAVDAGGNFIVMEPGLWDRNVIRNIGLNVTDMAFDETTGTMYLTSNTEDDWGNTLAYLHTIDLLTGELTEVGMSYGLEYMPWAMTCVNGELYAIVNGSSYLYKVVIGAWYTYLDPVLDAEGNYVELYDSYGAPVTPDYYQSMTYSAADGKIYWSYFNADWYGNTYCELFTIDPTDYSYTSVPYSYGREYVGLLTVEDDGYTLPVADSVTQLLLSTENLVVSVGGASQLTAAGLPWNVPMGEVTWAVEDDTVAYVDEYGVVYGLSEGSTWITATCGDAYAECVVHVENFNSTLYGYNYYSGDETYGDWFSVDMATMNKESLYASPVDFIAAEYNGHDNCIYGLDGYGQFWCYDLTTQECAPLGTPITSLVADMAYDYSTGLMYAIIYDAMNWTTTIYNLNMHTGDLVEVATANDLFLALACDSEGSLYAMSSSGTLYYLSLVPVEDGGGMPWSLDAQAETSMYVDMLPVMDGFGSLAYQQSMTWDHNNNVLLWACTDHGTIYWIGGMDSVPFAVSMGEPTGTGLIQYFGLYTKPEPDNIEELPYVPVESISAEDMALLVGGMKELSVSVSPVNATSPAYTLASADESIAAIVDGYVVGVSVGTTTINGVLTDTDPEGNVISVEFSFTVSVKNPTDNIFGFVLTDIATGAMDYWAQIPDADPSYAEGFAEVQYQGYPMTLYAAEYVNGLIYAYGYNAADWEANFTYMIIDAATFEVLEATDMGDEFPFVYDMAFDYTSGAMYALAGQGSTSSNLYIVDMESGVLVEYISSSDMNNALAVDAEGNIYVMGDSQEYYDEWTWESGYTNAILYKVNKQTKELEMVMDTGIKSNMLASMAYDHDTGYIYWAPLFQDAYAGTVNSGLYLIDLEDLSCSSLGTIGIAGAQMAGMIVVADSYPEIPAELQDVMISSKQIQLTVGGSAAINAFTLPSGVDAELSWSSSDESVAIVDENGIVTAISSGVSMVTVTATSGDSVYTASCRIIVYGEEDYFIAYNWTDGGFSAIDRLNPTQVTNLTEGEGLPGVVAMATVNGVIYGYDEEGNLFSTSAATGFERVYIGHHGIDLGDENQYLQIRDMTWDAANERLLAVASIYVSFVDEWGYLYEYELDASNYILEVDPATGAMTPICLVGGDDNAQSSVMMMEVDANGEVYFYTGFSDSICHLDLETGEVTQLVSFQNIGMYGSLEDLQSMTYDVLTNCIYLLWTSNGSYYRMFTFDLSSNTLSFVANIGEVVYDEMSWSNVGDSFSGLVLNNPHIHSFGEWEIVEATCTEDGSMTHTCACGETETVILPAIGHDYDDETGICHNCGQAPYVLGDANGDGKVSLADAIAILRNVAGLGSDDFNELAADVTGDSRVSIADAIEILRFIAGIITEFSKG